MKYLANAAAAVLWIVHMLLAGVAELIHVAADGVQAARQWLADYY